MANRAELARLLTGPAAAFLFAPPRHAQPRATMRAPVRIVGVPGDDSLPLGRNSSNMQAGEIFTIAGRNTGSVEAMGAFLPYGASSGWDE